MTAIAGQPSSTPGIAAGGRSHRLPKLVFDLDGTLSDPFDGIWRSANNALEAAAPWALCRAPAELADWLVTNLTAGTGGR